MIFFDFPIPDTHKDYHTPKIIRIESLDCVDKIWHKNHHKTSNIQQVIIKNCEKINNVTYYFDFTFFALFQTTITSTLLNIFCSNFFSEISKTSAFQWCFQNFYWINTFKVILVESEVKIIWKFFWIFQWKIQILRKKHNFPSFITLWVFNIFQYGWSVC
jgi:hypothetical protein